MPNTVTTPNPLPRPVIARHLIPVELQARIGTLAHAVNAYLLAGEQGTSRRFAFWTGQRHDIVAPHLSRLYRNNVISRVPAAHRRGFVYFFQPAVNVRRVSATESVVTAPTTAATPVAVPTTAHLPRPRHTPVAVNGERTFGVEIECLGDQQAICRAMRQAGLSCEVEGYNHATRTHWKVVTDSSVHGGSGLVGCELVSPVLCGADGEREVELACTALRAAGVRINRSCGLHVHQGNAETWDAARRGRLFRAYGAIEPVIDSFMPPSRRNGNVYCASCRDRDMHDTRYFKLNASLRNLRTPQTVEFRQHSGTFEAPKVLAWVRFTRAMMDADLEQLSRCTTLVQVLGVLNLRPEDVTYFIRRQAHFNNI